MAHPKQPSDTSLVLYADWRERGVEVSTIFPGFVDTPLTAKNTFPMPMLISVEQASEAIQKGLDKGQANIYFPKRDLDFKGWGHYLTHWQRTVNWSTVSVLKENKMKIAIIGTGISGLSCGYHLHEQHDITVFEANDYIGGHTATVDVEVGGKTYAVDTGFIVYNDRTYPNFIGLMAENVRCETTPTEMSFSVRNDANGLEYNGHTIMALFAQKRNWLNLVSISLFPGILRFNKLAKARS